MRRVYKYEVPLSNLFPLDMPRHAKVLAVQAQHDRPQLWVLVDPIQPIETRSFGVFGTGHDMPDAAESWSHLGTFQLDSGSLVFHLFDRTEPGKP